MGQSEVVRRGSAVTRKTYGAETIPLPVRTDPRVRLIGVLLGFVASSIYVISAPVAIYFLAVDSGLTISEVFTLSGVSLIATLWIFQAVGFAVVGFYGSVLVLRKKAQAGAGWIVYGIVSVSFALIFLLFTALFGAWLGIAAGSMFIVAGAINML